ncbi:MAG: Ubiquinone biosynthesis O-methyltransferase [Elusimicrobia bacterium]|nr:Ubiquinone biosynthesis O-methyltransferase [Elusimicrobiota bacterium]
MNSNDHESWNEEMAKKYMPDLFISQSGLPIRWVENRRFVMIKNLCGSASGGKILDVGCGSGNLLEKLNGDRLVGIDLSDTLLNQARERLKDKPNCELIKADIERLPFERGLFDCVICSEVLEHVENPKLVIDEMFRVIKPQGLIVITVPNETLINWTKRIVLAFGIKKLIAGKYPMSDDMREEWHKHEISRSWILDMIKIQNVKIREFGVPFSFLPYHRVFSLTGSFQENR